MFTKILVPLDGSSTAEMVLPYAEMVAAKFKGEILIASVSELRAEEVDHLYRSYQEHIIKQVEHQLKNLETKEEAKVKGIILFGRPADEILKYAKESNIDLIIMASRGRSSRGPWLLGNIAAKVLRATEAPVLLIRKPIDSTYIQEKGLMRRILLPLDGSKLGEKATPYAEALALAFKAELILFQVYTPSATESGYRLPEITHTTLKEVEEHIKESAQSYLQQWQTKFQERGLITSCVLRSKSPADRILEYAEENGIDLIAMSTHGRSGLGRWVFGSVTDKVLHSGDIPVLTVRAMGPGE